MILQDSCQAQCILGSQKKVDSGLNPWVKLNSKARICARNWWVGPICIGMWLKNDCIQWVRAPHRPPNNNNKLNISLLWSLYSSWVKYDEYIMNKYHEYLYCEACGQWWISGQIQQRGVRSSKNEGWFLFLNSDKGIKVDLTEGHPWWTLAGVVGMINTDISWKSTLSTGNRLTRSKAQFVGLEK